MKTIQETVETIIKHTPFIEEAMQEKLINVSSLARAIKPEVEQILGQAHRVIASVVEDMDIPVYEQKRSICDQN